jgi:hypothetical protein
MTAVFGLAGLASPGILDDIPRALRAVSRFVAHKASLPHCLEAGRGQEELTAAVSSVVGPGGIVRVTGLQTALQEREVHHFCMLSIGMDAVESTPLDSGGTAMCADVAADLKWSSDGVEILNRPLGLEQEQNKIFLLLKS